MSDMTGFQGVRGFRDIQESSLEAQDFDQP